MTDKNLFEAIITLPSDGKGMLMECLSIINQYTNIELFADGNGNVYYRAKVQDLLDKDITEDDVRQLNSGSWKLDGNYIVNNL